MTTASASGINLLFQSRPRIDRLTFDFTSEKSYPPVKHCPYSLVPLSEGSLARLIEDTTFNPELVQGWLREYDSDHRCVDSQQARDPGSELRVIDVLDVCVVEAPAVCRYAALSYVWGKTEQPILRKDNFKLLVNKDSLNSLSIPQTIKDAMQVCRLLGLRYLWVDSLCIIQDSHDHARGQISNMHNVYREAYLSIVVAAGADCASGIPSIQSRPAFPSAVTIDQCEFAIVPHVFDAIEHRVRNSTWNQRCWTMQESALSRRRLVFSSHEYFLSCDEGLYLEALAGKLLQPHRSSIPPLPKFVPGKAPTQADGRRADLSYSRIVSLYVGRQLTFPEDILRAFEGMANVLAPLLGPFQWGHPHRLFRFALCWSNYATLKRRAGFPSWSWTGWHHPHRASHESTSTAALSTWPFLFPSFGTTDLWPHCSLYLWQTMFSPRRFDHVYELQEHDWPVRPHISGALGEHINDFLQWAEDDCAEHFHGTASLDAILGAHPPSIPESMGLLNPSHVISFRSTFASFRNTWFPPQRNFQTIRSYVMDIELLEPRFHATSTGEPKHRVSSHTEAGTGFSAARMNLIFIGQLQHHVVVLPVQFDVAVPVDDEVTVGPQILVAQRQGNPFRMFNDVWYKRAKRCVVHLW